MNPIHPEVTEYREWEKGSVFHISFRLNGKFFMRSVRDHLKEDFKRVVLATIEDYLKKKAEMEKIDALIEKNGTATTSND